jgi:hypothetical protein
MFCIALSFCSFCLLSRLVSLPGIMLLQSSSCGTAWSLLFLIGSHLKGEMKMLLPEMLLPGLLLLNRLLGAVAIFGGDGVAAVICLCGLLSVCRLLLAAGDAEGFGYRRSVGCCRLSAAAGGWGRLLHCCFLAAAALSDCQVPWFGAL